MSTCLWRRPQVLCMWNCIVFGMPARGIDLPFCLLWHFPRRRIVLHAFELARLSRDFCVPQLTGVVRPLSAWTLQTEKCLSEALSVEDSMEATRSALVFFCRGCCQGLPVALLYEVTEPVGAETTCGFGLLPSTACLKTWSRRLCLPHPPGEHTGQRPLSAQAPGAGCICWQISL